MNFELYIHKDTDHMIKDYCNTMDDFVILSISVFLSLKFIGQEIGKDGVNLNLPSNN